MFRYLIIRNVDRISKVGFVCFGFALGVGLNALALISLIFSLVCDFLVSMVRYWKSETETQ